MADLLNASDLLAIRNALGDVYDTFLKYDATIRVRSRVRDNFKQGINTSHEIQEYTARCLPVQDTTGTDAENLIRQEGSIDFTEGRFLFAARDLEALGIFSDGVCSIVAERDELVLKTITYKIMGVNIPPAFDGGYQIVFLQVKKEMV